LRFGAQNGKIDTCWGHGIEFATGCLNYIEISACYIYANSTHGALLWSQSFASYQSIRALTCTATQFITLVSAVPAYFNINAYSAIRFIGCQWIGSTGNMFGKDCRTDSYSKVLVKIDGGAHTGNLILQDSSGFDIECEGFMNDSTGRMVTKTRSGIFTPIVRGGSRRVKYIGGREIYGRYHRQGNIIFFKLRIQWSRYTELVKTEPLQITGFPLEVDSLGASSVSIEYWGGNHPGEIRPTFSDGVVNLFSVDGSPVAMSSNGDIILSGFYSIKA
jgi:hypothetical protein